MKVQAIVPLGGSGRRFSPETPKALADLRGKPLFIHTLEVLTRCPRIGGVILVAHESLREQFSRELNRFQIRGILSVIAGGETRQVSVRNGLDRVDTDTDLVLVHDGVRPLVSEPEILRVLDAGARYPAVVLAVPVKPTIKRVDAASGVVVETLPREELWEIQTPQVFQKDVLVRAHAEAMSSSATDDAALVENIGVPVRIIEGSCRNIKITTPEDLIIAEALTAGVTKETPHE